MIVIKFLFHFPNPQSRLVDGNSPLILMHLSRSIIKVVLLMLQLKKGLLEPVFYLQIKYEQNLISFSNASLMCCKSLLRSSDSWILCSNLRQVSSSSFTSSINLKKQQNAFHIDNTQSKNR